MTSPEPLGHDDYDVIEDAVNDAVSVSLDPRGPDFLYEVIAGLGLAEGATAVDVGCGEGRQTIELARRFSLTVQGVDPLERRLQVGRDTLRVQPPPLAARVSFRVGTAEAIPAADQTVELILCRETLYVVADVAAALTECRRIATPTANMIVYQLFSTASLEPEEAAWFWGGLDAAQRTRPEFFEASVRSASWAVADMIDLRSETVEWAEEHDGKAGRELLAAARLLREPDHYIERFGRAVYDIKLNDALWSIYRMIGKLTQRIYVLSPV